jgi:hypothetical protein
MRSPHLEEESRTYRSWSAKSESVSKNSNRPGSTGCSMNPRPYAGPPTSAYVDAVNAAVRRKAASISSDAIARWSQWALTEANRIDPVKTARFIEEIEEEHEAK